MGTFRGVFAGKRQSLLAACGVLLNLSYTPLSCRVEQAVESAWGGGLASALQSVLEPLLFLLLPQAMLKAKALGVWC